MTLELWSSQLGLALGILVLLPLRNRSRSLQLAVLLALLALGLVPVQGLPLVAYPRALVPELSIVALVALGWVALVRAGLAQPLPASQRVTLYLLFGALGLLLYPAALGLGPLDPYGWGYGPRTMLVVLGLLALLLLYLGHRLAVAMLALATLAFALGLLASENYWDYLLDPLVVIYCWLALLVAGARRLWSARSRPLAD